MAVRRRLTVVQDPHCCQPKATCGCGKPAVTTDGLCARCWVWEQKTGPDAGRNMLREEGGDDAW